MTLRFHTAESFAAEQEALRAKNDALERARLVALNPRVAVLRHKKIAPDAFPQGTRLQLLSAELGALRAPCEEAQREFQELRAQRDKAQADLDILDPESAPPERYRAAAARLEALKSKTKQAGENARNIQQQLDTAEQSWRAEYQQYERLVDALNAIDDPHRPLRQFEKLSERADEAGAIARIEFLIDALLTPARVKAQGG